MFYPVLGRASGQGSDLVRIPVPSAVHDESLRGASTILRNGKEEPLVRTGATVYNPPTFDLSGKAMSLLAHPLSFGRCSILALFFTMRSFLEVEEEWAGSSPPHRLPSSRYASILQHRFDGLHRFLPDRLFGSRWRRGPTSACSGSTADKHSRDFFPREEQGDTFDHGLRYFVVVATLCVLPLVAWPIWPQSTDPRMIPLMLTIAA